MPDYPRLTSISAETAGLEQSLGRPAAPTAGSRPTDEPRAAPSPQPRLSNVSLAERAYRLRGGREVVLKGSPAFFSQVRAGRA